jgi:hypothetical protein
VAMPDNRVGDAADQGSPCATKPPSAHNDEVRSYVVGNLHDLLGAVAHTHPQVLLHDFPSGLPDLLDLLGENGFRLLPKLFEHFRDADAVGRIAGCDGYDVQLRVGGVGQSDGGGEGQLRLAGAVGGQKDRGRDAAHPSPLFLRR